MGWLNDQPITLTIPSGAGPNDPRTVIGANPVPPELVAYYAAGAPETTNPPEIVAVATLSYDGQGNYAYQALVVNSGNPKITSQVEGTTVSGTVREFFRTLLNPATPNATQSDFYRNQLFLEADVIGVDVLSVGLVTDQFGRFVADTSGGLFWGPGVGADTDTTLYRAGVGLLAADPIKANVSGSAETWHQLPLVNGWTQNYVNNYRLIPSPANSVQMRASFNVPAGARGDATVIATLPAAYRPAQITDIPATCDAQIVGKSPHFSINTTGDMTCWGMSNATLASISGEYALDA